MTIAFKIQEKNHLTIIDVETTINTVGNADMAKEILEILYFSLPRDRKKLEEYYELNDIENARNLLHRLDGSFRYCCVPELQRARTALHSIMRHYTELKKIDSFFTIFYQEIDNYMAEYKRLCLKGIL